MLVPEAEAEGIDIRSDVGVFLGWCDVMDKIMLLKTSNSFPSEVTTQELLVAIDAAIAGQIAVYGLGDITPKYHRMQHIPAQIAALRFVF